jgi:hypothetical protein
MGEDPPLLITGRAGDCACGLFPPARLGVGSAELVQLAQGRGQQVQLSQI